MTSLDAWKAAQLAKAPALTEQQRQALRRVLVLVPQPARRSA